MKNIKQAWNRNSWMFAGILGVTGCVFALIGFRPSLESHALSDALFHTLQMFVLNYGDPPSNVWHHWARLMLPAALSIAVIQGILAALHHRGGSLMVRLASKDHVVICGGGIQARELAQAHLGEGRGDKVALVHLGDRYLEELNLLADAGAVLLTEDASREDALLRVGLHRARVVYVVTGNDQTNLRIFHSITTFMEKNGRKNTKLVCLLHFYNRILGQRILDKYLFDISTRQESQPTVTIDVRPFNSWLESARHLYQTLGPDVFYPVKHAQDPQPHAIIIGRNCFSEQLIDQGAFLGQYLHGKKLRITLLGPGSVKWLTDTINHHPALNKQLPVGFWDHQETLLVPVIDLEADETQDYGGYFFSDPALARAVIYICMDSLPEALEIATSLEMETLRYKNPIVLCSPGAEGERIGLHSKYPLDKSDSDEHRRIYAFSTNLHAIKIDKGEAILRATLDSQALALHNSFWKKEDPKEPWTHNDHEWARESSRQAVSHLPIKSRAFGWSCPIKDGKRFTDHLETEQSELLSRMEHQRWCAERLMFGWRYAPQKNASKRLHRDLKIFDRLDFITRSKDEDIVKALNAWKI